MPNRSPASGHAHSGHHKAHHPNTAHHPDSQALGPELAHGENHQHHGNHNHNPAHDSHSHYHSRHHPHHSHYQFHSEDHAAQLPQHDPQQQHPQLSSTSDDWQVGDVVLPPKLEMELMELQLGMENQQKEIIELARQKVERVKQRAAKKIQFVNDVAESVKLQLEQERLDKKALEAKYEQDLRNLLKTNRALRDQVHQYQRDKIRDSFSLKSNEKQRERHLENTFTNYFNNSHKTPGSRDGWSSKLNKKKGISTIESTKSSVAHFKYMDHPDSLSTSVTTSRAASLSTSRASSLNVSRVGTPLNSSTERSTGKKTIFTFQQQQQQQQPCASTSRPERASSSSLSSASSSQLLVFPETFQALVSQSTLVTTPLITRQSLGSPASSSALFQASSRTSSSASMSGSLTSSGSKSSREGSTTTKRNVRQKSNAPIASTSSSSVPYRFIPVVNVDISALLNDPRLKMGEV